MIVRLAANPGLARLGNAAALAQVLAVDPAPGVRAGLAANPELHKVPGGFALASKLADDPRVEVRAALAGSRALAFLPGIAGGLAGRRERQVDRALAASPILNQLPGAAALASGWLRDRQAGPESPAAALAANPSAGALPNPALAHPAALPQRLAANPSAGALPNPRDLALRAARLPALRGCLQNNGALLAAAWPALIWWRDDALAKVVPLSA